MSYNYEQIGDAMLARVMQYCDGVLEPVEAALIAQQIADSPELQALLADLRLGASAAREVMAEVINQPLPIGLAQAVTNTPDVKFRPLNKAVIFLRQHAAAALVGLIAGAAAVGLWSNMQREDGLRLASSSNDSELFSASSRAALLSVLGARPALVNAPFNLPDQTDAQGTVSVTRWFDLPTGTPCAEFAQTQAGGIVASGIACRRKDGSWDVIALPADRK